MSRRGLKRDQLPVDFNAVTSPREPPPSIDRKSAKEAGLRFYFERSGCAHGHVNNKRYASSGECFLCVKARTLCHIHHSARLSREVAMLKGLPTYEGSPCVECGGTIRTTQAGACVACIEVYLKRIAEG